MRTTLLAVVGLALAACLTTAPRAEAAHHLVNIREVFPGSTALGAGSEFVELQLLATGENLVAGSATVRLYNASGGETGSATFASNPPNGQSQRTMLAATADAAADFGVIPDLTLPAVDGLSGTGGAVCFTSTVFGLIDCVTWGGFNDPPPSAVSGAGSPAAAIPDGSSLERTIGRGCATLLDSPDDTDQSSADFAAQFTPSPRPNSVTPTETACSGPGPGPGPGAGPTAFCRGVRATNVGSTGGDVLRGTAKRDVIAGRGGPDTIRGLAGNDLLCGGKGRDKLIGGKGRDRLFGGPGRDTLRGGAGKDKLRGGPGRDKQIQ